MCNNVTVQNGIKNDILKSETKQVKNSGVSYEMPVKQGETVWDVQARIEKKSDENATKTYTVPSGKKNGIVTDYFGKDGKQTGSIFTYGGCGGKTCTAITEFGNEGMKSGTTSYDIDNNGTVDKKIKFCQDDTLNNSDITGLGLMS